MATPLSAAQAAEVKRKASLGIPLTDQSNAAAMSLYNASKPMSATQASASPATPKVATPTSTPSVTPMSATAAANPVAAPVAAPTYNEAPQTNYGGKTNPYNEILYSKKQYDAGNTAWAANNAKQYYSALSADEAAKVQGMNTQQLIDYINGMNAPSQSNPTQAVGQTDNGGYYPSLTPNQIQSEAQAQLDRERAALQTAANQRLSDLKNNFQYSNQLLQDNRVLEDQQLNRTLNPFSGRTSYDKAMVNRGRGIDDNNRTAQFNTDVAAVQEDLYNFDKLAPERQQQVINELTRLERQYGIDVANLTGNFGNQRTLAGQQLDWGKTVDTANLTGNLGGQKTLAAQNQQFNQDMANKQFDRGVKESDRAYEYQKARDSIADERYKQEFDYNVQQNGLDYALRKAAQDNQIANTNAQTALDYQSYADKSANSQTSYSGLTSNQIYDAIKSQFASPTYDANGRSTGSKLPTDPTQRKAMITQIINSTAGLSDSQVEQIAASLGVASAEWKSVTGHGLGE